MALEYKLGQKLKGLAAGAAALTVAACDTPERIGYNTQFEAGMSIKEQNGVYLDNMSVLDMAEADRERRCFIDNLKGQQYDSLSSAYEALDDCVGSERAKDMAMYIGLAVLADGTKVYFFLDGLFGGGKDTVVVQDPTDPVTGNVGRGFANDVGRGLIRRPSGD